MGKTVKISRIEFSNNGEGNLNYNRMKFDAEGKKIFMGKTVVVNGDGRIRLNHIYGYDENGTATGLWYFTSSGTREVTLDISAYKYVEIQMSNVGYWEKDSSRLNRVDWTDVKLL